jgi:uncharacterized protein
MKGRIVALGILGAVMLGVAATHAEPTFPEMNGRLVMDEADLIPAGREAALANELHRYSVTHGPQIAVVTIPSLEGADPVDYGNRLFRHLKLGDKKRNDGVLLMIAPAERKIRIEVGYGLEPQLTDLVSNQINRTVIGPKLKAGDFPGGIEAGVAAIEQAVMPEPVVSAASVTTAETNKGLGVVLLTVLLIISAIVGTVIYEHRRARRARSREVRETEARLRREALNRKREAEWRDFARREAISQENIRRDAQGAFRRRPKTQPRPPARAATMSAAAAASVSTQASQRRDNEIREREQNRLAEERRARDRRDEEDRRRREDSYASSSTSSWSSNSDSSSSSSDYGGGGSSGGGGDTSSY